MAYNGGELTDDTEISAGVDSGLLTLDNDQQPNLAPEDR